MRQETLRQIQSYHPTSTVRALEWMMHPLGMFRQQAVCAQIQKIAGADEEAISGLKGLPITEINSTCPCLLVILLRSHLL